MPAELDRRLGLVASTAVGISAMVGAGLFVVFGPAAAAAAGSGLFIALGIAAGVAACNAVSTARLAMVHAVAGGTYVYARERLGPFWGHLAGWAFIAGKTASCGAMALALGAYLWPDQHRLVAVLVVVAVTGVNLLGVEKSALVSIVIVAVVVTVTLVAIVAMGTAGGRPLERSPIQAAGVLEAAAMLFFAFAGYARLTTLGEEVREPARTIPRAMAIAMILVLALYAATAAVLVHVLGTRALGRSTRPFVDGLESAGAGALGPWIVATAALAAGGAVLSLTLGVSRTVVAMGRDRHLPHRLATISTRRRVPHLAEIAVAIAISALVLIGDLSTTIAFSSFCVLAYYAIAQASAYGLHPSWTNRAIPVAGLCGCILLAASLPTATVVAGSVVLLLGALSFVLRHPRRAEGAHTP